MIEMLLSGGDSGGGKVPKGTIIGFSGTLAQANALNDWVICDGTNNTPDLNGRMIIGASGDYPFGSEGIGGRIAGEPGSTAGAHYPGGEYRFDSAGEHNPNSGYTRNSAGGHSHTLQTSTIPSPAARQTLFIQANRETRIPQYGVVWMVSAPRQGVVVDDGVFNRFLVGVTGSARGNVGNDYLSLALRTSSEGYHKHEEYFLHGNTRPSSISGGKYPQQNATGAHTHTVASKTVIAVPPWYGLIPGEAKKKLSTWEGLVLAYNGSLAPLPAPWREFTQLRGRFPRGASIPRNTGGTAQQTVTATPGTNSFSHNHKGSYAAYGTRVSTAEHTEYSEVHSHDSMSLTYSNLPPYKALHYITI